MIGRAILCFLVFVLLSAAVAAQGTVLKVNITAEENKPSKEVADILGGKIGSTLRYALTNVKDAVIVVDVVCVDISSISYACTAPTNYYPPKDQGLNGRLSSVIAIGNSTYVAETLFNNLVQNSSDEKLTAVEQYITFATNTFWIDGFGAGYKAGTDAAKKPASVPKKN